MSLDRTSFDQFAVKVIVTVMSQWFESVSCTVNDFQLFAANMISGFELEKH